MEVVTKMDPQQVTLGPSVYHRQHKEVRRYKDFVDPRSAIETYPYCGSSARRHGVGDSFCEHESLGAPQTDSEKDQLSKHHEATPQPGAVMYFRYVTIFDNEYDMPPPVDEPSGRKNAIILLESLMMTYLGLYTSKGHTARTIRNGPST